LVDQSLVCPRNSGKIPQFVWAIQSLGTERDLKSAWGDIPHPRVHTCTIEFQVHRDIASRESRLKFFAQSDKQTDRTFSESESLGTNAEVSRELMNPWQIKGLADGEKR
jgi:hypothetical protein